MIDTIVNIRFPEGYVALKGFPGYFWNANTQHLYTMKVTGELRPLAVQFANWRMLRKLRHTAVGRFISADDPYFVVSRAGKRRTMSIPYIKGILDYNHIIPFKQRV